MPEENNCPKPDCGRPESTHRYSAGKRLSICGNGHSWDAQEVADQRRKAKEAERQEDYLTVGIDRGREEFLKQARRARGGMIPDPKWFT